MGLKDLIKKITLNFLTKRLRAAAKSPYRLWWYRRYGYLAFGVWVFYVERYRCINPGVWVFAFLVYGCVRRMSYRNDIVVPQDVFVFSSVFVLIKVFVFLACLCRLSFSR